MKSFLTATAILLAMGAAPALAQSSGGAGATSTSSGGQYTGGGIAGTSNGGGTAGTAATANNAQTGPDYDSSAANRRNAAGNGRQSGSTTRTMSQGPNGTPRMHDGPSDKNNNSPDSYQPKTPP